MKVTLFSLLIVLACLLSACRKDISNRDNLPADTQISLTDNFDFAADEAQYLIDDTEGDNDAENSYIADAATPMKIQGVFATDSLPILNPVTGKKQKYAKRQIVNTTAVTRFTLKGYGFKAQSDTSAIQAIIAKTKDTLSFACQIISWSDTEIVLNLPTLTVQSAIDKYFSLKLKVFRSNDKENKLAVSRTKSRACISRTGAETVSGGSPNCTGITSLDSALLYRTNTLGFGGFSQVHKLMNSTTLPLQVGDIVFETPGENFTFFGKDIAGVVTAVHNSTDVQVQVYAKKSCTEPTAFPSFYKSVRYTLIPTAAGNPNKKLKAINLDQDNTYYRLNSNYLGTYMR